MSADNGIYIVPFSDGFYRVAYASAIDNLDKRWEGTVWYKDYVKQVFGKAPKFVELREASDYAYKLESDMQHSYSQDPFYFYLEYGICTIKEVIDAKYLE